MRPIGATRETDEDVVDARELALAEQAQLAAHLCEATLAVIVAVSRVNALALPRSSVRGR